jgi:tripartite-type tricarboxylate transporter receptor subunit TctC
MMIVSGHITNPLVMANAGYDALKDSTAISLLASSPLAIFAHPSFAANDIKGAIALAKEKPNTIGYATPGVGSIQQLSMELLSYLSGAKFLHVPYRGGAPALNDTIGGHVPISVLSVFQVLPLIQEGKLKALAVTDTKRTAVLPNVQTVAEAGVANYEASLLFGLIAPPGLPPAVLAKINAEVVRIINAPEMQKKLAAQGVVPIASTPGRIRRGDQGRAGQVGSGDQGGEHQGVATAFATCLRRTSKHSHGRGFVPASPPCIARKQGVMPATSANECGHDEREA